MNAPRPKLGDVFGKRPPDRSEGLGGLLSPSPRTPPDNAAPASAPPSPPRETKPRREDESAPASEPASHEGPVENAPASARPVKAEPEPSARPTSVTSTRPKKHARNRPGRPASSEVGDDLRLVPVNLDASVHSDLKHFSTRIERNFGVIVLEAVENTADELAVNWKSEQRTTTHRLFVGHTSAQQRRRRKEPAMQVLLRLPSRDAETLDQLVSEWEAPSRSALVTEALRRYLTRAG